MMLPLPIAGCKRAKSIQSGRELHPDREGVDAFGSQIQGCVELKGRKDEKVNE